MLSLILGVVLAIGTVPDLQSPPTTATMQADAPVFRAGVYVVPIRVVLIKNKQPWTGLTIADFEVVLDKRSYLPEDVVANPDGSNRYTVFFKPPDAARDGKKHNLQLKVLVRKPAKWGTLKFNQPVVLPKASAGGLSPIAAR